MRLIFLFVLSGVAFPSTSAYGCPGDVFADVLPPGRPSRPEPAFLRDADVSSARWCSLFVRWPGDLAPAPYVANHTEAIRVFDRWIRGELPLSYAEMLRRYHRVAALGPGGNRPYRAGDGTSGYESAEIHAGSFRHEISGVPDAEDITQWLTVPEAHLELFEGERGAAPRTGQWPTAIEGIPLEACPHIARSPLVAAVYHYPAKRYLPLYLARMEELMARLRALPPATSNAERRYVVELLADYYHVSVNALPFARMNNSMLMGQVNYLLQAHGMNGMRHANLDYIAFGLPTATYRRFFVTAVEMQNWGRF